MNIQPALVPTSHGYPTSDGKPMAETDRHRELMFDLIKALHYYFLDQPDVYVSGNLLLFYEKGNKRKHISPDVMVVRGVHKGERMNYLVWVEGKAPQVIIELTSSSTRAEDTKKKYTLYQDVLKVKEYFLFDPCGDYLDPRLQGYRRSRTKFRPIEVSNGRLPSAELGLHLERAGDSLRLWDPATERWLRTPLERAESAEERAESAEEENLRLRRELDELRKRLEA